MKSWMIFVVAALGFVIYGAVTKADRDSDGTIVGEGNVDPFEIRVGDCFDDAGSDEDEVSSLPGVPCAEPHDNETFAVFDVDIETYPDDDTMGQLAHESCLERFEEFVGKDYETSSLDIFSLYPTSQSWKQKDREVICAVYDMEENKLTGTVKGSSL